MTSINSTDSRVRKEGILKGKQEGRIRGIRSEGMKKHIGVLIRFIVEVSCG